MPGRITNPVAVCAFDLSSGNGLQLFPAGAFNAVDGRPHDVESWYIDAAIAQRIIDNLSGRKNRMVIDYEHQTLNAAKNGQPAPAAGWINPQSLEWRDGEGLFVTDYEWTPPAKQYIDNKQYAFLSPVFPYNNKTGAVAGLLHVGLVNDAGIDGMAEVVATKFNHEPHQQEIPMDKLLKLLGLKDDAGEDEVLAACKALQDQVASHEQQMAALKAQHGEQVAALKADATGDVDPAKYVPVSVFEDLKTEVVALKASAQNSEVDDLVSKGLADGKLLPAQESWAKDLGTKTGVAALKSYLDATPAIAALKGQQTAGRKNDDGTITLSDEQIAVCKQLGIDQDDYIKTLEAH